MDHRSPEARLPEKIWCETGQAGFSSVSLFVVWFHFISSLVFPLAVQWAKRRQREGLRKGRQLTGEEMRLARRMGVREAQNIRILELDRIPIPGKGLLGLAARHAGFHGSDPWGLSLGYAVFVRRGWPGSPRHLLAHEFVHTAQFERLGGMNAYLTRYLEECLTLGYSASPMEQEAVRLSSDL